MLASPGFAKLNVGVLAVFPDPPKSPPPLAAPPSPGLDCCPNTLEVGAFPVLCPKSEGFDASEEPKGLLELAFPEVAPKENFGGSGMAVRECV